MVASYVEGRVRIRNAQLRDPSLLALLQTALQENAGVESISANQKVGSLLVFYDKAKTTLENIMEVLTGFLTPAENPAKTAAPASPPAKARRPSLKKAGRKAVNLGMLGSLLACLLTVAADATSLHIITGLMFLAVSGVHMLDKRRTLIA